MTKVKNKVNRHVPVLFQQLKTYEIEDERFVSVKIWLMHTGRNYNGSIFSKEAVINAIPTLANTPILAFLEEDDNGEQDFSDHRTQIVVEDGQYKEKYMGQAIGIIPETNNAQFEYRVCDDGVEREFLTVQGLLWTKWEDPVAILQKHNTKDQSMELSPFYSGEYDEDGYFHFKEFKFDGACILGNGVQPAMEGATVELAFQQDSIEKTIQDQLGKFSIHFNKEGDVKVEKEIKDFEETEVVETEESVESEVEKTEETQETFEEENKDVEAEATEDTTEETTETTEAKAEEFTEEVPTNTQNLEEMFAQVTQELKELSEKFEKVEAENKALKADVRARELNELRQKFEGKIVEEELNKVFEAMKDAELADIEKEVFATIGRLNFETLGKKPVVAKTVKDPVVKEKVSENPFGSFFERNL